MYKDLHSALAALAADFDGELLLDTLTRGVYATDASIYEQRPLAVAIPRSEQAIATLLAFANRHHVPLLARGSGTSLAGQAVTTGIVVDFTRHFDRILSIDAAAGTATVQPGVVRDQLNAACAPHGLFFAPDPATTSRATLGGMIANNSSGANSIRYGRTIDHLLSLRLMLADGSIVTWARGLFDAPPVDSAAGRALATLKELIDCNRAEIEARYPRVMRRVGGYCLDAFLDDDDWNPARIICGSEGTLAIILEATVGLVPAPRHAVIAVVHFDTIRAAIDAVPELLTFRPDCVEILDEELMQLSRSNPMTRGNCGFIVGNPGAVQVLEFTAETPAEALAAAEKLAAAGIGTCCRLLTTAVAMDDVWKVRKNGLGLMLGVPGTAKPIAFIEDAAIPLPHLSDYIEQVLAICREQQTRAILYAHASVGVIHVRPILDLRDPIHIERMKAIGEAVFHLVKKYGGSLSGEHGDGLVRGHWNERFFGEQLYAAFRELKAAFDPQGILNPGKIVDVAPMDSTLRYGAGYRSKAPQGHFRYREPGGFEAGVDACTGVGACRTLRMGTMCPSFRATRNEAHSTRGRATIMRLAMAGRLDGQSLTGSAVAEALDLCLSCKACKTECPSNVDLARLKAEVQQLQHDEHGASLGERLAAAAPKLLAAAAGPMAGIANTLGRSRLFRRAMLQPLGFDPDRPLPPIAARPWRASATDADRCSPSTLDVAVLVDCWNANCEPEPLRAALALLQKLGYRAAAIRPGCCQRTRISHGFLRDAARDGQQTLNMLDPLLQAGVIIVGLEPSCVSAFTDDLPDLIADTELGARAAAGIMLLETFLAREKAAGRLRHTLAADEPLVIQPHCHQRALTGTGDLKALFAGGGSPHPVTVLEVGCCGMAGSFGHELRHRELSAAIFNDRLAPALAKAPTAAAAAPGFSCRCQIRDLAHRPAKHWVQHLVATAEEAP